MRLELSRPRSPQSGDASEMSPDVDLASWFCALKTELDGSYWQHFRNQELCEEGMEQLQNLKIPEKTSDRFLLVAAVAAKEIFSHVHCNLLELPFNSAAQREIERRRFWSIISEVFAQLLEVTMTEESYLSLFSRMSCLLSYASLFSLYKDVASDSTLLRDVRDCADELVKISQSSSLPPMERRQLAEMNEGIQVVFILREEGISSILEKTRKESHPPTQSSLESVDAPNTKEEEHAMEGSATPEVSHTELFLPLETLPVQSFLSSLLNECAEQLAVEAIDMALQTMELPPNQAPPPVPPPTSIPSIRIFPPSSLPVSAREEEPMSTPELPHFDPEAEFELRDKIARYGRRGLFDEVHVPVPIPVIILPRTNRQRKREREGTEKMARQQSNDRLSKYKQPATDTPQTLAELAITQEAPLIQLEDQLQALLPPTSFAVKEGHLPSPEDISTVPKDYQIEREEVSATLQGKQDFWHVNSQETSDSEEKMNLVNHDEYYEIVDV